MIGVVRLTGGSGEEMKIFGNGCPSRHFRIRCYHITLLYAINQKGEALASPFLLAITLFCLCTRTLLLKQDTPDGIKRGLDHFACDRLWDACFTVFEQAACKHA